jgi:RNA polymerase sigma factor (sigma-70 family)
MVGAARLGDSHARDVLWARCFEVAKQMARQWSRNKADTEDLTQDALLSAIESFEDLRDPASLLSWLQVVMRRSLGHEVRRQRRRAPLLTGGADPELLLAREPLPDSLIDLQRMFAVFESLPEEERTLLWLRRAEGLPINDIVREMALSPSSIRRRLRVAERRLAKRLSGRPTAGERR